MKMEKEQIKREEEEEENSETAIFRDRFRLSSISIAETEANKNEMEIAKPIVACVADLAFKYTEQLAMDLELFAQHAGRKSVNMDDVILSAHINEQLTTMLKNFSNDLKAKGPQSNRRRKRTLKKDERASTGAVETS